MRFAFMDDAFTLSTSMMYNLATKTPSEIVETACHLAYAAGREHDAAWIERCAKELIDGVRTFESRLVKAP